MLLTLGITYHNEGELLTRCLKSFWQEPEKPFEILIYDDASTKRPEDFIPSDIPVRILRNEKNQGPAKGRNRILKEAQGDWIHFHDADDWLMPGAMEKITRVESETDLILTEVSSYQSDKVLSELVIGFRQTTRAEDLLKFAIRHFILVPSMFVRTELARKIKGYRESLWQSEDWDFSVRVIANSPRVHIFEEALSAIQIRSDSRSQNQIETLSCVLQAILLLKKELPESYQKDLADKAAWAGTRLFALNERKLAREAFDIAQSLGPPSFSDRKKFYRLIANRYGQETAERAASAYHLLKQVFHPRGLRRSLTSFF